MTDRQNPDDYERRINRMLLDAGYPPDKLDTFWDEPFFSGRSSGTPRSHCDAGKARWVHDTLAAAYGWSRQAAEQVASDPELRGRLEQKMADLDAAHNGERQP